AADRLRQGTRVRSRDTRRLIANNTPATSRTARADSPSSAKNRASWKPHGPGGGTRPGTTPPLWPGLPQRRGVGAYRSQTYRIPIAISAPPSHRARTRGIHPTRRRTAARIAARPYSRAHVEARRPHGTLAGGAAGAQGGPRRNAVRSSRDR